MNRKNPDFNFYFSRFDEIEHIDLNDLIFLSFLGRNMLKKMQIYLKGKNFVHFLFEIKERNSNYSLK